MSVAPLLIYLHGFLSSPASFKARQTLAYCQRNGMGERIVVPELLSGPAESMDKVRRLIDSQGQGRPLMFIGSSLGGYYATHLAEAHGAPAVLINPAVRPFDFWETHLGEHHNYYTDTVHVITEDHIRELEALDVPVLSQPRNFRVLLQEGDETLDYRLAVAKYGAAQCDVRENGNHSFVNYEAELPGIFQFLLSRIGQPER